MSCYTGDVGDDRVGCWGDVGDHDECDDRDTATFGVSQRWPCRANDDDDDDESESNGNGGGVVKKRYAAPSFVPTTTITASADSMHKRDGNLVGGGGGGGSGDGSEHKTPSVRRIVIESRNLTPTCGRCGAALGVPSAMGRIDTSHALFCSLACYRHAPIS